ncbi:MAG TPA: rhomboid family intramembrane serine protease [Lysobacter sp.]|nr:rhomboid family intramembrane serine protease [Lysobacter sp.]
MLILPLHRPLNRANFPIATALLVLINVFVYFGFQVADESAMDSAQRYYVESGLGRYEAPAYQRHLENTSQREALAEWRRVPAEQRAEYVGAHTITDVAFTQALYRGELFANPAAREAWKPLREKYEALQGEVFTLRHVMRSSEIAPWRMFAATFLHGDAMHLLGNMIFLVALGLLVEGALGSWRYLAVYLLGAFGSSAVSLWWRWGEAGGGLGASGAIAALMGAFCVVWGRQPVRFFYWFGVVFDYVRAPAIWLLPLWLGWEVYNLLANGDLGIGFDAHAGGIIVGALAGGALVGLKQVRQDFIRDEDPKAPTDDRWERAQAYLGKMQLAEAERLLEELAQEQPQRFEIRLARYRVARAGKHAALAQRAQEVLALPVIDAASARQQREVFVDLQKADVVVDELQRLGLAKRWLLVGELDGVEALLEEPIDAVSAAALAQLWLELALRYGDRHARVAQTRTLRRLIERHPDQPQAAKAKFLLENTA